MKYWLPILICCVAVGLLGAGQLVLTVKTYSEQRQQRIDQEIEERVNGMREECRLQFPHDAYMRVKCYQRMMAKV